jgi:hypothetical protein
MYQECGGNMPDVEFDVEVSIGGLVIAEAPIGINFHPENMPTSISIRLDDGYMIRIKNIVYVEE